MRGTQFLFWAYSAFVLITALLPPSRIPSALGRVNDKFLHAGEYAVLAFLSSRVFSQSRFLSLRNAALAGAWIYCLAMGVVTEIGQYFVPGRFPEFLDWFADGVGSGLCLVAIQIVSRCHSQARDKGPG